MDLPQTEKCPSYYHYSLPEEECREEAAKEYSLLLYCMEGCPYCKRVTDYLAKIGKKVPIKDIRRDKEARATLIEKGGKPQVPCLMINGEPLYESEEIVAWLGGHSNAF